MRESLRLYRGHVGVMVRSFKTPNARQCGANTVEYGLLLACILLATSGIPEITRTIGDKLVRNDFFSSPLRPGLAMGGGTEGGQEMPMCEGLDSTSTVDPGAAQSPDAPPCSLTQ